MELTLFHLDTYSNRLFGRPPATLAILDHWLPGHTLQQAAAHHAADGITFLVRRGETVEARSFTAEQEVEPHQRATLAAAWFYFRHLAPGSRQLALTTVDAHLATIYREARGLTLELPAGSGWLERLDSETALHALGPQTDPPGRQPLVVSTTEPYHLQDVTTLKMGL